MRLPYPIKRRKSNPIVAFPKSIPILPRRKTCKTLRLILYFILACVILLFFKSILFKKSRHSYSGMNMDSFLRNSNSKIESNELFFKPKIYIKYSKVAQTKKKYFDSDTAQLISKSLQYNRVELNGFHYCGMLNGSIFNTNVHLFDIGGSLASVNPSNQHLIRIMDTKAESIHQKLMERFESASSAVRLY